MSQEIPQLTIRNIQSSDYPEIKSLMDEVYVDIGGAWSESTITKLISDFPEGQIGIFDSEKLVGMALTLMVDYQKFSNPHKHSDLIDARERIQNNDKGDALYGLDVIIRKNYRGYRLGRRLYDARKELCKQYNLRAILAGGRIPNYKKYMTELKATEYIQQVASKQIYDPILTFQLSNDFQVKRLLKSYLPEDDRSGGYATLLEWNNILYEPDESVIRSKKTNVRVGAVQWQLRSVDSLENFLSQVEYFVDTVSDYQSDFILFPEFFNASLMGLKEISEQDRAMRELAGYTEVLREKMSHMAVSYNTNIITGSMPLIEGNDVFNVSYLCHRDGSVDEQRKIHMTPHEKNDWVLSGGTDIRVFDTDAGRVGILICYDVEFPELSRIMAKQGLQILFVPFWTDTKNSYLRVRICAQARAIENECYVVIAGNVGNLPSVESLDVQYAQSAVFSPSDLYFPHDAVLSEATPNTEMLLFGDLDLVKLKMLHDYGSVKNLQDRREELYKVELINKEQTTDN